MKSSDVWRIVLILLLPLPALSGCNKKKAETATPSSPAPENAKSPIGNYLPAVGRAETENDFRQFHGYYLTAALDPTGKPPRSLAEMPPEFRRDMPKTYKRFAEGNYVVFWGADFKNAPAGATNTLLAYEKAVPEKGGVVVFLDGHIRNVTAQEFQTFAKPGTK
jgi:hypothetical protein